MSQPQYPHLTAEILDKLYEASHVMFRGQNRKLAYDIRGAQDGFPCFWFHGSPSGRLEALLLHSFGLAHNLKIIAVDRPGLGQSDPHPGWTMTSFAEDTVALADHLKITKFSVAGGSGGGPFVLALAAYAPDRIHKAVSLACAGAFELAESAASIGWVDRWAAWAVKRPFWLSVYFGLVHRVCTWVPSPCFYWGARYLGPTGQGELGVLFQRALIESFRQGISGVIEDTCVLHRPWGFDLGAISIPVVLVNGTKDEFVGVEYGRNIAQRVPQAKLYIVPNGDHFRTIFDMSRLAEHLGVS